LQGLVGLIFRVLRGGLIERSTLEMPTKSKPKFGQKSEFVRSLPANTPAAEVVAAAKKRGISITPSLVYNIRSTSKQPSGTPARNGKPGPKPGRKGRAAGAASAEIQLRNAIAALGITKTREILAAVEAAFAGR